ncbi:MAG: hypothetical protein H6Q17_1137 [Bacteroidetes bacterium]|nr:hypothetical protein [Bacteroidota bacterium]
MKMNKLFIGLVVAVVGLASCHNADITYPNFDYQTVYFANQYPARTVELGEDLYVDNSIDNQHKIIIKATMGGTRDNKKNVIIDFKVDNSLCNGIYFASQATSGSKVIPMPSNYYSLASNQITIPPGSIMGGVEVQLTDAFFADPMSLVNTYAIPLLMTSVQNADSILQGRAVVDNPNRCVSGNWSVAPKDYVLYVVKYVNTWHGNYLRRGTDVITKTSDNSKTTTIRHATYVENNDLVKLSTSALLSNLLPLTIKDSGGKSITYNLVLNFDNAGNCTVNSNSSDFVISGKGKYVSKGDKNSIGGIDRDALYLDYSVNFTKLGLIYATQDTLVLRDRTVAPEYYTVAKN